MKMLSLILNSGPTWKYPRARRLTSGRTKGMPIPGKAYWTQMRRSERPGRGLERGRAGQRSLQTRQAGRQAVRGPEAPHQPPVGPQPQPDFTSS